MVTTISGSQYRRTPINNVTPFTYRDGMTYLEILHSLTDFVNGGLVEDVKGVLEGVDGVLGELHTELKESLSKFEAELSKSKENDSANLERLNDVAGKIVSLLNEQSAFKKSVNDEQSAFKKSVNDRVNEINSNLGPVEQAEALRSWLPKMDTRGIQGHKLTGWKTALLNSNVERAQIVCFGDSITEGSGASDYGNRWQTKLQDILREYMGIRRGAKFPFIPAKPVTRVGGKPVWTTGNVTDSGQTGFLSRGLFLKDTTGVIGFNFYGTSAQLHHLSASATGKIVIQVDNKAPVTYDTNYTRNPTEERGNTAIWGTGPLERGEHTLTVSLAGGDLPEYWGHIFGLSTFDQDEVQGIRTIDASYHGSRAATFIESAYVQTANMLTKMGGADLAIIGWGMNNFADTSEEFRTQITNAISWLRAGGMDCEILLLGMYYSPAANETVWPDRLETLRNIAFSDPKISFLDLTRHMPPVGTPYNAPASLNLYADSAHPNDNGMDWMAKTISNMLLP